jgi:hypothetical protein
LPNNGEVEPIDPYFSAQLRAPGTFPIHFEENVKVVASFDELFQEDQVAA